MQRLHGVGEGRGGVGWAAGLLSMCAGDFVVRGEIL